MGINGDTLNSGLILSKFYEMVWNLVGRDSSSYVGNACVIEKRQWCDGQNT